MIRFSYINDQVLKLYTRLPQIKFPLNLSEVVKLIPNCRVMTYQHFAEVSGSTIDEVIENCESEFGCTHHDVLKRRFLIMYNASTEGNNNLGRQRWTVAHELGHVVCQHMSFVAYEKLCSERFPMPYCSPDYEAEADYFAATLLAPFPYIDYLGLRSAEEIQEVFGLSVSASLYAYKKYLKWKQEHFKKAWENDMIRIYEKKHT